jgi:hypothetical protein
MAVSRDAKSPGSDAMRATAETGALARRYDELSIKYAPAINLNGDS